LTSSAKLATSTKETAIVLSAFVSGRVDPKRQQNLVDERERRVRIPALERDTIVLGEYPGRR